MEPPKLPRASANRLAAERELHAGLNLLHFRGLKLASLRWAAATSFPLWLEAQSEVLPGVLVWPVLLTEVLLLALAAFYAALEYRWVRRAAQLEPTPTAAAIHAHWTDWDELPSALWHAMAIVSLILWFYVGFGRPLPASLLSALTATAAALFLLVVVAETAAQLHAARRRSAGGSDAPPLQRLGHGNPR